MSEKESPDYVQISTAAAMTLKIFPGRFNRGERLNALNLLVVYDDSCKGNCGYCGLSQSRDPDENTFIRVDWPIVSLEDILARTKKYGKHLGRVCVSMITHPRAFDDMCTIMSAFRDQTDLLISGLIAPTLIRSKEKVMKIKEAGADMVGIAVDAATQELFRKFRGEGVNGPHKWDQYWKVVEWSAECFGRGKAGIHLIVGLGETEKEIIAIIQKGEDLGAKTHLFSFYPEGGSSMSNWKQPSYGQYRRVQLARYLINSGIQRAEDMKFNDMGELVEYAGEDTPAGASHLPSGDLSSNVEKVIESGEAFMTSGCAGHDGVVACNRPYGNERPSRPIRNFAFLPEKSDIDSVRKQLVDYSGDFERSL
ncbi:MAG: radical SAM protein [Candidatus Thermoplasmatota archaeon]|jgi:biotin synthase|nr:radical SAM protein [Candidatus Thermoplasmatota archaeon]MDP7266157.1 radical SAM protein [Candidatus Thermoplasmatota archaeon]MDP7421877.1 radical SAM protein [bacterium]